MVDTLHPPPQVIASWPKPNYVDPHTHGPGLMVLATLLPTIAIVVVITRLYARFYITRAPGIDDVLIVLALIFGVTLSSLVMVANQVFHNGRHIWDIPPELAVGHRLNIWICQLFYTLALGCVKISVLLFYRRLSVSFTRGFLIAVWVGIIYNIIYMFGFILTLLLLCQPVSAYWNSFNFQYYAKHDFHCGSEQLGEPLSAAFSVIGDFYSTLLPLVLVSRLSLPKKQKRALYGLFSLGFTVVIAGIVRNVYMYRVVNVDYDFTWTLWKIWMWGEVELWVAVYCASAPALKPFFKKYFKGFSKMLSSSKSQHEMQRKRTIYVVRSNSCGGLGKTEKITALPRVRPESLESAETSDDRKTSECAIITPMTWKRSHSMNTIVKSIDIDIERFPDPPVDARLSRPWDAHQWNTEQWDAVLDKGCGKPF